MAGLAVGSVAALTAHVTGLVTVATSGRGPQVAGVVYERSATAADVGEADPLARSFTEDAATTTTAAAVAPGPLEVAVAPPPEAFEAPAAPPPPPPRALRSSQFDGVQPAGGTWAVIIGINDYPGTRYDLRSAVSDANDVDTALAHLGVPGSNRLVIRDGQATAGVIRAAADWLRAHAGPDAVVVFFYAGHVRKLSPGVEAIIGADGGTVTDSELADILRPTAAQRGWIAIAACYGGGFTELRRPGWVLTAASGPNDIAYENQQLGRSYLVEYMVRRAMIENRASRTVESAFAWARDEIARDYPSRVPVQFDDDPRELDLRPPGTSAAPPPSSTPPPSSPPPTPPGGSEPEPPDDDCQRLTIGVVRCGED